MLKVLLCSQPVRTGWVGGSAFSTVAHGGLIAAAVLTTGGVSAPVREKRDAVLPTERVTYLVSPPPLPLVVPKNAPRKDAPVHRAPKPAVLVAPDAAPAQSAIDQSIAALNVPAIPDLAPLADKWLTQPDALSTGQSNTTEIVMERLALSRPADGLYTGDMVEESVRPERGNPTPRYPEQLERMGIEGDFLIHFVVDSTGHVDKNRIEFPSSMHQLFAESVRDALLRSHYVPARVGGTPVSQLVVQEFRFTIRR